jgi:membrane-associated phospholipid phosphatase
VRRSSLTILALVASLAAAPQSRAAEPSGGVTGSGLHTDWTVDGIATGAALAAWGALELGQDSLVPSTCRWCTPPGLDENIRSALAWSDPNAARTASNVLIVSIPVGFLAYDLLSTRSTGGLERTAQDVLVVTQTIAITGVLTDVAKFTFARLRPYAVGSPVPLDSESRVSFWSGHSAIAFAAAAAAGSVAQRRGYDGWPWVYAVGFTAAAGTAYLRVAADQHWFTDVLVGAAVGTAVGFFVPWLHRGDGAQPTTSLVPIPNGLALAGRF